MKVIEFMICDYVNVYYIDHPVQVVDITADCLYTTGTSNPVNEFDYSGVNITYKILSVNGFRSFVDDEGESFLMDEVDRELQIHKEGYNWRIRIQRGHEASVSIKARYVHELQHAMRLMGLNDLADNFKVV